MSDKIMDSRQRDNASSAHRSLVSELLRKIVSRLPTEAIITEQNELYGLTPGWVNAFCKAQCMVLAYVITVNGKAPGVPQHYFDTIEAAIASSPAEAEA